MLQRLTYALATAALLATSTAAQVVRFETNVGEFDMVLNPTNNPLLQGYVDNLLQYVKADRYHCAVINRADENFVLQMGSFKVRNPAEVPDTASGFMPLTTFAPVEGVPAAEIGLSNTIGTVALALPGDGMGGTNQDAGTSSFFVNLTSNTFLDADFTVFAEIPDLTTINAIMALDQVDLTQDPDFGAGPGNLAFTDVPLRPNGGVVIIARAFVLEDTLAIAAARAGLGGSGASAPSSPLPLVTAPAPTVASLVAEPPAAATLAADFTTVSEPTPLDAPVVEPPAAPLSTAAVPEPATYAMLLPGILGLALVASRRRA